MSRRIICLREAEHRYASTRQHTCNEDASIKHQVRFDRKIDKFAVLDTALANQTIGLHDDFDSAFAHAEAEEDLWRRYGGARHAADIYQRQRDARWVA
ncbi:MAG: hypothetical protein RIC16_13715 [Rhodospirillales bacterium]